MKADIPLTFLLIFSMIFLSLGCGSNSHISNTKRKGTTARANPVTKAQNDFSFKLFGLVVKADHSLSNKMISPLSIYQDLSMVYNGTAGKTREAMQKALQLNDMDTALLNTTSRMLFSLLAQADTAVQIDMVNSIWYREDLHPLSSFLNINNTYYNAEIQPADFSNPQTINLINGWVADHTQQKIKSIIDHINPADVMFLINAIYFNGKWQKNFDPKHTRKRTFYTASKTEQVSFMYREARYNYAQASTLQIVELPYGNGSFSMYVLLPAKGGDIHTLIDSLNASYFSDITNQMDSTKVKLFLPKWEASYTVNDLIPQLTDMGMGIAFGPQADFTGMYQKRDIQISSVVHKSYIKVDEEGTEAAAATSIGMRLTAAMPDHTPVMDVNRPFVYIITENRTNSILFLGVVNNPEAL